MDVIEKVGDAQIQHGPYNDRVYLMKLGGEDPESVLDAVHDLTEKRGYAKVFAKVPEPVVTPFLEHGYRVEAIVPRLYRGREDAVFLGKYFSPERSEQDQPEECARIRDLALSKAGDAAAPLAEAFELDGCGEEDAEDMAKIYRQVFASYPFPIHDPEYLRETMRSHVAYFGVRRASSWVALSSAEMEPSSLSAEMTDFATLPDWRGHGFAIHLLDAMEEEMAQRGIRTVFTIARALSPGMNITFAKAGYEFGGTLVNNTNISGSIESMNVWYKAGDACG